MGEIVLHLGVVTTHNAHGSANLARFYGIDKGGGGSAQRFEQCLHGKPYGPVRRMMRNAQAVFFSVGEILDGLVQNGSGGFLCAVGLKFHIPYERHLEILPWLHHL